MMKCKNCIYYKPFKREIINGGGLCFRFPPVYTGHNRWEHPVVIELNHCGEFDGVEE